MRNILSRVIQLSISLLCIIIQYYYYLLLLISIIPLLKGTSDSDVPFQFLKLVLNKAKCTLRQIYFIICKAKYSFANISFQQNIFKDINKKYAQI